MQRYHDILRQISQMRGNGCLRRGKEPKRPGRHVSHGNDNAMQQSISRRLFKDAGNVPRDKVLPVADATVCHAPPDGRIDKKQPVSGIVRYPIFRICLLEQRGMIEPDSQADRKIPVRHRNQTLQLVVYPLYSFHGALV